MRCFDFELKRDQKTCPEIIGNDLNIEQRDARLPHFQRVFHKASRQRQGFGVQRRKSQLVETRPKVRAHHALTGRRAKNDPNRLLDFVLRGRQAHSALPIDLRREHPSPPNQSVVHSDYGTVSFVWPALTTVITPAH